MDFYTIDDIKNMLKIKNMRRLHSLLYEKGYYNDKKRYVFPYSERDQWMSFRKESVSYGYGRATDVWIPLFSNKFIDLCKTLLENDSDYTPKTVKEPETLKIKEIIKGEAKGKKFKIVFNKKIQGFDYKTIGIKIDKKSITIYDCHPSQKSATHVIDNVWGYKKETFDDQAALNLAEYFTNSGVERFDDKDENSEYGDIDYSNPKEL